MCFSGLCDQCATGYYLHFPSDGAEPECAQSNIAGYGISKYSYKYLSPCEVANCELCYLDASTCTKCTAPNKVLVKNNGKNYECVIPSNTAGLDNSNPDYVKGCNQGTSNCELCDATDYTVCTQCESPKKVLAQSGSYSCVDPSTSYGLDTANTNYVKPCSEGTPNCQACSPADYKSCTSCSGLKKFLTISGATSCTDAGPGYGLDPLNPTFLKLCSEGASGCQLCDPNNYQSCTQCTGSKKLFLGSSSPEPVCMDPADGYGLDPSNLNFLKSCSEGTSNCQKCDSNNYSSCLECVSGYKLIGVAPSPTQCIKDVAGEALPEGFGVDPSDPTKVVACLEKNCKSCQDDSSKCTECQSVDGVEYKLTVGGECAACVGSAGFYKQGAYCMKCDPKCKPLASSAVINFVFRDFS